MSPDARRWAATAALGLLVCAALDAPAQKAPAPTRPAPPAAPTVAVAGKARARVAYASEFAAGAGQALATRACLLCHSALLTTQQAKDSTGWEKTLATMKAWGVQTTPAEHDTLRRYLLAHYGPRR